MSELNALIEEHGVEIARYERDFNDMGSAEVPQYAFQQLYNISSDPRPIITVGGIRTDSYGEPQTQLRDGMIAELTQEAYHVQFKEQLFGATIRISLSAMRNGQQFSAILADEMDSLMATVNLEVMKLFSENPAGWDGKALIANDHPVGDTVNINKVAGALSQASFETYYGLFPTLKNSSGVPKGKMLDTLLVPPQLMVTALKLSRTSQVIGSDNNDVNLASGVRVIVEPTFTSATKWYAINTSGMKKNLLMFFQEPFKIMLNEAIIDSLYIRIPTRVVLSWGYVDHEWIMSQ